MSPSDGAPFRLRDVVLLPLGTGELLAVACDSAGGIGDKEQDGVRVGGYVLGRFTARVALAEVLAVGARPLLIVNTLSVEWDPAGREIWRGIRDEAAVLGLDPERAITGSSEENVVTCQTGIGVTVIGRTTSSALRLPCARPGDVLVSVGRPKVGAAVSLGDPDIADLSTLLTLLAQPWVKDIIPVGSRGIAHEAGLMAEPAGGCFLPEADCPIDLTMSAGPATCLVAAVPPGRLADLRRLVRPPIYPIGRLAAR